MGFLSSLVGAAEQLAGGQGSEAHFDQVARNVPQSSLAQGLASALGSGGSGQFAQMASQLFSNGNGDQKASMLNTLISTAGPEILSQFPGAGSGSPLSSLLQAVQAGGTVSSDQAAGVAPEEIQQLAAHVHQFAPSVVDRLGEVYSEHPALIKTLGVAALGLIVNHIAENHK